MGCASQTPSRLDAAHEAGAGDGGATRPDAERLDASPRDADRPDVPVPSWVPPPGEVAVLTQSNGGLRNRFIEQAAPYFEPYYYVNTVNDYSGAFKNPHWASTARPCSGEADTRARTTTR